MSLLPNNSKASVIISVYNRFDFLKLVLAGFERQQESDFEIIIADDGSNAEFITQLNALKKKSNLRIKHIWQEDLGFRKNRILNQAVIATESEYLIFIDGDCIPHPEFVSGHLQQAQQKYCLSGRRVDLSNRLTKQLTPEFIQDGNLESGSFFLQMTVDFLRLKLFHLMNGFYTQNQLLLRYFNRKERGLLGANFSLYKSDLLAINGFDERYTQPTFGEDTDVEYRLRLAGITIKPILNIAVLYHCYHKLLPRPDESRLLFEQVQKEKLFFTLHGINKPPN